MDFSDPKRIGYDLRLNGQNVFVQPFRQDMDLVADADLTVSGIEIPHVSGNIVLTQGTVSKALKPKEPIQAEPPSAGSRSKSSSLDVKVHVPGNFWIEGSDYLQELSVELKGDVQILKRKMEPEFHFFGDAETLRGKYQIYGNVFRISQGTISFGGISQFDPTLNIEAETQVGSEPIFLRLTGTLLQPEVSLWSQSGYSEKDVITLLTLGATSGTVDTVGVSGAFESKASSVLGSVIEGELARRARQQLGVDTFEITRGAGSQSVLQTTQVTVGKYLSERVYLEYSRRLAMESEQEVELEYRLNRHLSFLGMRDYRGLYHLQLQFKFDY
jgi:autotransporter translocation and assembly factor TamB